MRLFVVICVCLVVASALDGQYADFLNAGRWADAQRGAPLEGSKRHLEEMSRNVDSVQSAVAVAHAAARTIVESGAIGVRDLATCIPAVQTFLGLINSTTGVCSNIDTQVQNVLQPGTAGQTAAASFCTGCAMAAKEAIAAVASACARVIGESDARNLRMAYYFLTVTCIQDNTGTQYCVPTIYTTINSLGQGTGMIPTNVLDTTCGGGCFIRYAAAVVTLNPEFNATTDDSRNIVYFGAILCAVDKYPSNVTVSGPAPVYCINQLHTIQNTFQAIADQQATIQDGFNAICATRCIEKYAVLAGAFSQSFFTNITIVCHRASAGGELCVNRIFNGPINPDNIGGVCDLQGPPDAQAPCAAGECHGNVSAFNTQMGCCLTDFLLLSSSKNPGEGAGIVAWLNQQCQIQVEAPCPTFDNLVTQFVVYGLVTAYCQAHPGVCEAAIKYDIALSLGLLASNVNVTTPVAGPGRRLLGDATAFTVSINTDGAEQKQSTQADLSSAVATNGIIYAQTSQLPAGSKANAFGVVGTDASAVTFAGPTTSTTSTTDATTGANGAATAAPVALAIAAAAAALLL